MQVKQMYLFTYIFSHQKPFLNGILSLLMYLIVKLQLLIIYLIKIKQLLFLSFYSYIYNYFNN